MENNSVCRKIVTSDDEDGIDDPDEVTDGHQNDDLTISEPPSSKLNEIEIKKPVNAALDEVCVHLQ